MKKVLIITYYWPPAGGPGVQRWLKFVKYLKDFDIEPVVYIPENPSYPIIDKSFEKEIPKDIKIIKRSIFEPYALAGVFSKKDTQTISSGIIKKEENQSAIQKAMLYIRGNFFIPDARKFWVKPSVKFLQKELQNTNYHALITTGPPHSLHLIGLELSRKTGVKWIADFRDPWTTIGYHEKLKLNSNSRNKHKKLEKEVLESADHIITTSFTTKDEFEIKTSKPVTVITNGFETTSEEKNIRADKFQMAHVGSLLSGRNPENLWSVLGELIDENEDFRKNFILRLTGKISEEIIELINSKGLASNLQVEAYVGHEEALKIQTESAILLLIEIDSEITRGIIPGKLFEYMASQRPIMAIGPKDWDAEKILLECEAGTFFAYNNLKAMKIYITKLYQNYKNGESFKVPSNISKYHRKALTQRLAKLIHEL